MCCAPGMRGNGVGVGQRDPRRQGELDERDQPGVQIDQLDLGRRDTGGLMDARPDATSPRRPHVVGVMPGAGRGQRLEVRADLTDLGRFVADGRLDLLRGRVRIGDRGVWPAA